MIKKENGSSLLITLLIITIFTIVGLSVLSATINSAKQINNTESKLLTTNLAEMGIQIYHKILVNIEAGLEQDVTDAIRDEIDKDINACIQPNPVNCKITDINSDGEYTMDDITGNLSLLESYYDFGFEQLVSYLLDRNLTHIESTTLQLNDLGSGILYDEVSKITDFIGSSENNFEYFIDTNSTYTISNFIINIDKSNRSIDLDFTSIGEIPNENTKSLSNKFQMALKPSTNNSTPEGENIFENVLSLSGNNTKTVYGDARFKSTVDLSGNGKVIVLGEATFESTVTLSGNGGVFINGDTSFNEAVTINGGGNSSAQICVHGNLSASPKPSYNAKKSGKKVIFAKSVDSNLSDLSFISTDPTEFTNHCPTLGSPSDEVGMELDLSQEIDYVNYN